MANESDANEPADPLALGQFAASQLGGEWHLDVVEEFAEELVPDDQSQGTGDRGQESGNGKPDSGSDETHVAAPETKSPHPAPVGTAAPARGASPSLAEVPPSPEQLLEAMLFVGGPPLTVEVACAAVRGLTPDRCQEAVAFLNKRYRNQNRPYAIEARADGFVLAVRPAYQHLREKLFGGPREARLSQPALDVLSVVAYRQPLSKAEADAVRGTDSGPALRQLVRLGLIVVLHRADATGREVRYGTTPRFLQLFGLKSLDELPRLGDAQQV